MTDPLPGVTVAPSGTTNQWNFTYPLDADGQGGPGSVFSGTMTFNADPTDGVDPGDTLVIAWALGGSEGLNGNGTFNVTFQLDDGALVWGSGSIDTPDDCEFDYDIDQNAPMTIGGSAPVPVAEFFGAEFFGAMGVFVGLGSNSLEGVINFLQSSNSVNVSDVEFNGVEADDFEADLPFSPELLQSLAFCLLLHGEGSFVLLDDILEAIDGDADEDTTVQITQTGPLSASFVISFDDELVADVTGTFSFSADPVTAQSLTFTLRFTADFGEGVGTISTSNSNPIVIDFDDWGSSPSLDPEDGIINGRIRCEIEDLGPILLQEGGGIDSCVATADFYDYSDSGDGGSATLRAAAAGVTLRLDIISDEGPAFLSLNGVPLPPFLIDEILGIAN